MTLPVHDCQPSGISAVDQNASRREGGPPYLEGSKIDSGGTVNAKDLTHC
jgi:hypothetical protein